MTTQESERTTVHLMRRGEVHNPLGVLYGRLPGYHLSDLGREMAHTVARHLADHDVVRIVTPTLDRTPLSHHPRRRECSLASPTSLDYDGDTLRSIPYAEPAAGLLERARKKAGA